MLLVFATFWVAVCYCLARNDDEDMSLLVLINLFLVCHAPFWALAQLFWLLNIQSFGRIHPEVAVFSWVQLPPSHRLQCSCFCRCVWLRTLRSNFLFSLWGLDISPMYCPWWDILLQSETILLWSLFLWCSFAPPMSHSFWSPNSTASYLAILFMHLFVSLVNCSRAMYLNLIPRGDIKIIEAPALTCSKLCHNILAMVILALGLCYNLLVLSNL
jgi:hypothetical protein